MEYKLNDLIDVPRLQALMDSLDELYSIPSAIIDMEGSVLTGTSWQDICTKFHRANPESEKECIKSDTHIASELSKGKPRVVYKCPHGLVDTATPIVVDGKHLGSAFTGQFFLEAPDEEQFRELARKYGFNEEAYIEAMGKVPVISEDKHLKNLKVLANLAEMLAEQGLKQKRQLEVEQALRESRESFKTLVEFTEAVHWEFNLPEGRFAYVSPQATKMTGYPPEEWTDLDSWSNMIHPEDREWAVDFCLTQTKESKDHDFTYRIITKQGDTKWLRDIIKVVIENGAPVKLVGVMFDITSVKQSESEHKSIISTSIDGFWTVGLNGRFLDVNDSYCKVIGYSREELLNMGIMDIEALESPDETKMHIKEIMEQGSARFESKHRKKDGDIIDVEVSTMYSSDERLFHVFIRDISERKRMEAESIKAQKLESLGVLAGGIAHDFNNLLSGIFSTVSVARQISDKESEVNKVLAVTEMVLERTKDLTHQLLTFSKGGAPIKAPMDVTSFLKECVRFSLSGSSLKPELSIPGDIWPIDADLGQMNQVIQNLVSNASEAMPQGGTLKVSASNTELGAGAHHLLPEGRYVAISVSDTGDGIPEENISKIFDPFYSTKKKGSGLGLASVHSIIAQHGGAIDVKSGAGKGTTFTVYLPVSEREVSAKETPVEEAIELGGGRILLMDDEEVIRDSSGMMLRHLGFDVVTATNGEEALKTYEEALRGGKPFDAVILDLTVRGGMGGERTIKRLIKIDPDVRAIVSSGYSNDPVMGDFKGYGFKGVIEKPYNIERMSRVLKEVLAPNP